MSIPEFEPIVLPVAPLFEMFDDELGAEHAAASCGVSRSAFVRWKRVGHITLYYAEQVSHALGLHPSAIWGMSYYYAVKEDEDRRTKMMDLKLAKQRQKRVDRNKLKGKS